MYRFQINAHTHRDESIGLVGSTPQLGLWDVRKCVRLRTNSDSSQSRFSQRYSLWWIDLEIDIQQCDIKQSLESDGELKVKYKVEYKYVRFDENGIAQWESSGSNRWVPFDPDNNSTTIVVDDGAFGYLQPYPFGYIEEPVVKIPPEKESFNKKILVIGSSVALGHRAWLLKGWAWLLGESLQQKYGHKLVNVSEVGANVSTTIARFASAITSEKPDVVIIALSLGNEGLAHCPAHERRAVQKRFESGLLSLVKMARELGVRPILGGVYPNGHYSFEHYRLLQETHKQMLDWGVPVLDWLAALDNGQGRWKKGTFFDPAHPNTVGHQLMYEAIDLGLFGMDEDQLAEEKQRFWQPKEVPIYLDNAGFHVSGFTLERRLRIFNPSQYSYTITPYWHELQTVLQQKGGLIPGIYISNKYISNKPISNKPISNKQELGTLPFFAVQEDGTIGTTVEIPSGADLEYNSVFNLFSPNNSHLLFYDEHLGILKEDEQHLLVINESDHEYNIQPMWQEVRLALKQMPEGVYDDPLNPDTPFRTMMIGKYGLESRVKVPSKSAVRFQYKCKLSDIIRTAILPLGDRCAVRMMLHKMEYDGPAFPFDLTRTTKIGDVADAIENGFHDMWNPTFLHYSRDAGRIYHSKWAGLSFAHEVEKTDDPVNNMSPVYERMRVRYTARSERFWYVLRHCDRVLFVRTGITNRDGVIDLVNKLEKKCQGKPFHLLLFSPQSSDEFSELPNVLHYSVEFNPDRMYKDLGHWMYCTEVMRSILESLGVSSKNLFWCPAKLPKDASKKREIK